MRQSSRRIFLKYALGGCAAGALIRPLSSQNTGMPYYKAVFDERFKVARAFAAEATMRAIPTAGIRGDVTSLFFNDLDLRWKQRPVWLIGLTTPASLFCVHLLARDQGMRLRLCRTNPDINAVTGVLDGSVLDGTLPRGGMTMHVASSGPSDLVLWIIAPSRAPIGRGSAKETANA